MGANDQNAASNGATDQDATAKYLVVAGNGVSQSQVQMRSAGATDLMFARNSTGGFQAGTVLVNGSGHDFAKDNLALEQDGSNAPIRKGKYLRVRHPDTGQFGASEVDQDPELGRRLYTHGYHSQYGEWKQQYERIVNYNQRIWYVFNPLTLFEDPPDPAILPHTLDTITITGIDIPAQMRGMPMMIKLGEHGSVVIKKVTWVAENGHRIELPAGNTYGLKLFGHARGGVANTGSCGYDALVWTGTHYEMQHFTVALWGPQGFGSTVSCPADYGFTGSWLTAGNTPLPTAKALEYPYPSHDYTEHIGNRLYGNPFIYENDPTVQEDALTAHLDQVISNLTDESVDYERHDLAVDFTVLPDKEYYGGTPFLWNYELDSFLPAPPFKNPDGGYFTTCSLEIQVDFTYDAARQNWPFFYPASYFSPGWYNYSDSTTGGCVRLFHRQFFEAVWNMMDAGEGWRMGFGGWIKGAWVGGWVTNFDTTSGLDKTQPWLYAMNPCELPPTYVGEGSSYTTQYFP